MEPTIFEPRVTFFKFGLCFSILNLSFFNCWFNNIMLLDTSRSMWPVTPVGALIQSLTRKRDSSSSSAWPVTHPAPCKPSKPVSRPSLASGQPSGLNSDTGLFFIYNTFYDNCPGLRMAIKSGLCMELNIELKFSFLLS